MRNLRKLPFAMFGTGAGYLAMSFINAATGVVFRVTGFDPNPLTPNKQIVALHQFH